MATAVLGVASATGHLDGVPGKVGRISTGGNYFVTWFDTDDTDKVYVRIAATIGGLSGASDQEVCDLSAPTLASWYGHAAHIDASGKLWVIAAAKDGSYGYVRVGFGTISGTTFTSSEDFWLINNKYTNACRWPDIIFESGGEPVCSIAYATYTTAKTSGFAGATSGNISADFTENAAGASTQEASQLTKDDDAEGASFYYMSGSDDIITRRDNAFPTTWFATKTLSDITPTASPKNWGATSIAQEQYVSYLGLGTNNLVLQQRGGNDAWDAAGTLVSDHDGKGHAVCHDLDAGDLYIFYTSTDSSKVKCQKYTSGVGWANLALTGDAVDTTNAKFNLNCAREVGGTAGDSVFLVWEEDGSWVGQDVVSFAAGGYTLTAAAGAFAWAGVATGLAVSRALSAAAGSYAMAGVNAGLTCGRLLGAAAGAFTLTGVAAGLVSARVIPADAGAYAWAGTTTGLTAARTVGAAVGAFMWAGVDVDLGEVVGGLGHGPVTVSVSRALVTASVSRAKPSATVSRALVTAEVDT